MEAVFTTLGHGTTTLWRPSLRRSGTAPPRCGGRLYDARSRHHHAVEAVFNTSPLPLAVRTLVRAGALCRRCGLLAVLASLLQTTGSEAGSGVVPLGLLTLGPWDLPPPGREPVSPELVGRCVPTAPTREAPRSYHCELPASPHPSAGSKGSGKPLTFAQRAGRTLLGAEEHLFNESLSPAAPTSDCCLSLFSKTKGRCQRYPSSQTFPRVLLQGVIHLLLLPDLPLGLLENPELQAWRTFWNMPYAFWRPDLEKGCCFYPRRSCPSPTLPTATPRPAYIFSWGQNPGHFSKPGSQRSSFKRLCTTPPPTFLGASPGLG